MRKIPPVLFALLLMVLIGSTFAFSTGARTVQAAISWERRHPACIERCKREKIFSRG